MNLLKAILLALKDVLPMLACLPKLFLDLFWCLAGFVGIILSIVLFPLIVVRKYKNLKVKKCVRNKKLKR